MKHIYFVRHGQTAANIRKIHQSPDEPLTPKGRKQAQHAALVLKHRDIDTIVCSSYARARETAGIISDEIGVPFLIDKSVVEFKRPDSLYHKSHFSPRSLWYVLMMFLHREDEKWEDDGAENIFAVRNRVLDAQRMIKGLIGEHIVIVSHTIFMNMFLSMSCKESSLNLYEFLLALFHANDTPNGGIIHMYYDERVPEGMCKWQLIEYIN